MSIAECVVQIYSTGDIFEKFWVDLRKLVPQYVHVGRHHTLTAHSAHVRSDAAQAREQALSAVGCFTLDRVPTQCSLRPTSWARDVFFFF